jgi:cytochrome c biogenesis protein
VENKKDKTLIDRIWDFFASIKLAIVIFAVLSLTSIVGTVIEQNAAPEKNIKLLAKFFGESAAPSAFRIFDSLGFMDMYHSWWFVTILVLFAANLIICSIDRLPKILKLVREPIKPLPEDHFKGFGIKREIVVKGKAEATKATVLEAVKKSAGFNLAEVREEGGYQLYSQRGNYTRLGIYITHFSILVILLGAIIGIRFGFKGFLPLAEGDTSNVIETRRGQTIPLGFDIRCDKFEVDFYGDTDMPKAYKSWLTVFKDGKEVMQKMIEVNNPLTYDGTTFYQSSFGMVPGGGVERAIFVFKVAPKDGKPETVNVRFGDPFSIPGTDITAKVEDFSPALGFDQTTGKPFTYAEQMNNPAVFVGFFEGSKRIGEGWILKRYPETGKVHQVGTVLLDDVWGIQYTGLQVRKDPGVWVVYFGCIAMAVGLFIAFFMSHRKLWVKLIEEKNNTRIIVGASANKNRQSFERKIDKLAGLLSKHREGGK